MKDIKKLLFSKKSSYFLLFIFFLSVIFIGCAQKRYLTTADLMQIAQQVEKQNPQGDTLMTVEVLPQFPGGQTNMMYWLQQNISYPEEAMKNGIEGRVLIRFVVMATGDISSVEVMKPVNPLLDREAVRVIQSMPKWIPGEDKGKKVNVYFTMPITFKLANSEESLSPESPK